MTLAIDYYRAGRLDEASPEDDKQDLEILWTFMADSRSRCLEPCRSG